MGNTKISWAGKTWNWVTGCSKVSAGCAHCYAERISLRYGWSQFPWTAQHATDNVKLHPDRLRQPYSWTKPVRCFVCSMADLFHPLVPDDFLKEGFEVMADLPQHVFMILTKRIERAARWANYPDNVWLGTSVEDAKVVERIDTLRQAPAKTRFVSFEPLIGPVGRLDLTGIHWAIVGGESGNGFRPMNHAWARAIRDQCVRAGTAFFFKQSASVRSESRTALIEEDGSCAVWHQFPDELTRPVPVKPGDKPSAMPPDGLQQPLLF